MGNVRLRRLQVRIPEFIYESVMVEDRSSLRLLSNGSGFSCEPRRLRGRSKPSSLSPDCTTIRSNIAVDRRLQALVGRLLGRVSDAGRLGGLMRFRLEVRRHRPIRKRPYRGVRSGVCSQQARNRRPPKKWLLNVTFAVAHPSRSPAVCKRENMDRLSETNCQGTPRRLALGPLVNRQIASRVSG